MFFSPRYLCVLKWDFLFGERMTWSFCDYSEQSSNLLLAFGSAVILDLEPPCTHDHIFVCSKATYVFPNRDSPFFERRGWSFCDYSEQNSNLLLAFDSAVTWFRAFLEPMIIPLFVSRQLTCSQIDSSFFERKGWSLSLGSTFVARIYLHSQRHRLSGTPSLMSRSTYSTFLGRKADEEWN
jgi:hypothetical protein